MTAQYEAVPQPLRDVPGIERLEVEIVRHSPFNAETPAPALGSPVTPSPSVYVRSNFDVPRLGEHHTIDVDGAVASPFVLPLEELRAMPHRTVGVTMECAGNDRLGMHPLPAGEPWRHGAVSTASWTGVPLRLVLERAGVDPEAIEIEIAGADGGPRDDADGIVQFARALPLADATHPDTLLALEMNGTPLAPVHGAPVRLVVPGWYGMAHVKWVSRVTARVSPYEGYFQRQRYVYDVGGDVTPVTRTRVKSIITAPANGHRASRTLDVRGWAWSGHGAITRVEVAVDGGDSWRDAKLGAPVAEHAWTPWSLTVSLPRGGRFSLRSRATDASGAVQPDAIEWNRLGYGNNAVRGIVVDVP